MKVYLVAQLKFHILHLKSLGKAAKASKFVILQ